MTDLHAIERNPLRHILAYSVPSIIAMLLTSLVVVVDGFFVSRYVGKGALAAINLGLPMLYLFLAFGIMIGVGGVSLAGRRLGEQKLELSVAGFNQTLATGFGAALFLSLFFSLVLAPGATLIVGETETAAFMVSYYRLMVWTYPFMIANVICGMFIRCEGKPELFMLNTIITTVLNIVLDYLFIPVMGMGVQGAAYSSAIAVGAGTLVMMFCFLSSRTLFSFRCFSFSLPDFRNTITNGFSEFIGQISFSITMFFMNMVVLSRMGVMGLAALSIVGYSRFIYDMVVVGFGQGISPMISVSYGAGRVDIGQMLRKRAMMILFLVGAGFYGALMLGGESYGRMFTSDAYLVGMVASGLRIFCLAFLFCGFNEISSFYFTSVGYARQSALISSLRGLVLLSANIFLLPLLFGDCGIWMVAPVTELLTCAVSFYLIKSSRVEYRTAAAG